MTPHRNRAVAWRSSSSQWFNSVLLVGVGRLAPGQVHATQGRAAGVDGVTAVQYEADLEANIGVHIGEWRHLTVVEIQSGTPQLRRSARVEPGQ